MILHGLRATRRARLHRHIGEAIERAELGDVEALAHHFWAAGPEGPPARAATYAVLAAKAALEALADEDPLAHAERGLTALSFERNSDRALRAKLLLVRGWAELRLHSDGRFRETAWQAAVEARAAGSLEHLARAAILFCKRPTGLHDVRFAALAEEALRLLGDDDRRLRAELLSGLATYRIWSEGDGGAAQQLSSEAIEVARSSGDPSVLAEALYARALSLLGTGEVAERLALADELAGLDVERDPMAQALLARIRLMAYLELGDVAGFERSLADFEAVAVPGRSWSMQALTAMYQAGRSFLYGRLGEAEELATEALTLAKGDPSFIGTYGSQIVELRRFQGRLDEVLAPLLQLCEERPGDPRLLARLAFLYASVGSGDDAAGVLDQLSRDRFASVPHDMQRPGTLSYLVEAAARLDDEDRSAVLLELLRPYAGRLVVLAAQGTVTGAADRYLGMAAAACRQWNEAEAWHQSALGLEEAVPAPPHVALTRLWYARMLLDRQCPGDVERSGELLAEVLATASELGLTGVSSEACQLRERQRMCPGGKSASEH